MRRIPSLGAILALAALGTAQQGPLVGFTGRTAPASSNLTRHVICQTPTTLCRNALAFPSTAWAGGAAYNPKDRSLWHTDGASMVGQRLDGCATFCKMKNVLVLGAGSVASGLTINPARRELYQLETRPGQAAIVTYAFSDTSRCPIRRSACRFTLPGRTHVAGAIAFDQKRDLLYVATSRFNVVGPQTFVLIFRRSTCALLCRIQVTNCLRLGIAAIRAMAYDDCKDILYISDGRQTSVQSVIWSSSARCPTLRPTACCPLRHPAGEFWAGFDLEPIHARQLGSSCTQRPCANCPSMKLSVLGDAVPGNVLDLRIHDGPKGALGIVFVRVGSCGAGLPLACGKLYPWLPSFNLPPFVLNGAGVCGGAGQTAIPIPNNFAFCKGLLCVQGVIVCPAGNAFGLGLTNAQVIPFGA